MKTVLKVIGVILILLLTVCAIGILILKSAAPFLEWGNHAVIEVNQRIGADSVVMHVCEEQTIFNKPNRNDSLGYIYFEGNFEAPDSNYPCAVLFEIYINGSEMRLTAESFNCNNCDVSSHIYKIERDTVFYRINI